MCGICGAINFTDFKINKEIHEKIKVVSNSLSHRGPDNEGFYKDENVSFGHRRLSIVDLSDESNQPMMDDDESIVIVFNGEIYNSSEIRKELEKDFSFKTSHSDTETIIYAYKKWGLDAIKKFSGMFALAIYDKKLKKCFLFRDRMGKKPLYFTKVDQTLYFSSEIQPLFNAGVVEKKINDEAIYHYLSLLTVHAPNTFFKDIFKLESGHYLEIDDKADLKSYSYWDVKDYINKKIDDSSEQAIETFEKLLERSMEYRNVSDVPISIAMSGGLDSSLNLYYSNKGLNKNISGINISYEETSEFDESEIAKKYAEEQKIKFYSERISKEKFEDWIIDYLKIQKDSPSGDINTSLVYGMSLIARNENAKVMLVGEGGDELGGYPIYKTLYRYSRYLSKMPTFLLKVLSKVSLKLKNEIDVYLRANDYSIRRFVFGFREHEKQKFWLKDKSYNSYDVLLNFTNEIDINSEDSFYRKILNTEYKLRLAELILPRIDYPSMAASIEARAPFMDHDLIEYTSSLPFNKKMNESPKTIIKSIAREKLPEYILNHPKVGFGQLLTPFFNATLPVWYKNEIIDNESPLYEYISKDYLMKLYESKDFSYRMWLLYSLHKWLKENS